MFWEYVDDVFGVGVDVVLGCGGDWDCFEDFEYDYGDEYCDGELWFVDCFVGEFGSGCC